MKRMLIDAAHAEETRVVLLDEGRIEDFESETQGKQQHKGNIYIGHVSRVEPSLQAAFITYGGNRNGFLAFGEVHPEYFNLPKNEKAALLEELAEQAARRRREDEPEDELPRHRQSRPTREHSREGGQGRSRPQRLAEESPAAVEGGALAADLAEESPAPKAKSKVEIPAELYEDAEDAAAAAKAAAMADAVAEAAERGETFTPGQNEGQAKRSRGRPRKDAKTGGKDRAGAAGGGESRGGRRPKRLNARNGAEGKEVSGKAEGADKAEGKAERPRGPVHRRYRIQDVLKEGQKILVQVVKEERGSKGAALTTYFSLPGRFTVLMPNTANAGGISRKITDGEERRQLREMYRALDVPPTMGVIIRTAGMGQEIEKITADYANLQQLWSHITQEFQQHEGIQCIHEDGSIIVRALRDMASDEVDEIVISGARAYKAAKDFAKAFMPEALPKIVQYKEEAPIFAYHKVEQKLLQLHYQRVQLPSGGSIVINPTEALVAIDINSGRNTQERNIEETAYKTNLEACEEIARQVRLRDLAGLIVVDFIDMENYGNTRKVEQAMRRALKRDRARVQAGSISEFGLMEISRQRLRPSFGESHFMTCPHCNGSGLVASPSTAGLMLLRRLEDEDARGADRVTATAATATVLWVLNTKRELIRSLEEKYKYQLLFKADDSLSAPDMQLELTTFKADGTELTSTVKVELREQPEVPPEKRYTKEGRDQRRREEEAREDLRRAERQERHDERSDERRRPEKAADSKHRDSKPGRPSRAAEAAAPAASQTAEAATPTKGKPEGRKPGRKETRSDTPRPARTPVVAEDAPLAVAKVEADTSAEPVVSAKPKAKVMLKKQEDTDRDLSPLAVATVAADETASKASKPKPASKAADGDGKAKAGAKKDSGILNRLLGL